MSRQSDIMALVRARIADHEIVPHRDILALVEECERLRAKVAALEQSLDAMGGDFRP